MQRVPLAAAPAASSPEEPGFPYRLNRRSRPLLILYLASGGVFLLWRYFIFDEQNSLHSIRSERLMRGVFALIWVTGINIVRLLEPTERKPSMKSVQGNAPPKPDEA